MQTMQHTVASTSSTLATNKLIKNTYMLLSMTLLFSAVMAGVAIAIQAPPLHWLVTLGGMLGLLFLTSKLSNSAWGLVSIFGFTGFMGFSLGPIISIYLGLPNGSEIVMTSVGLTGVIFVGLSAYAMTTKKDFSFMGGFLFAGLLVVLVAGLANIFLQMPALQLAISAVAVLVGSGLILYDTSRIINGGENNYIMATINLYMDIYYIFIHLLQILGVLGSDD